MRSAEEIIDRLKGSFNAPRTKDEKIKVVVFCIIISTTFWFFSALNKSDYVTQINYPIEFQYNEEVFVAVDPLPRNVRLEVSGGGWDLMTRSFGFGMEPILIRLDDPTQAGFKLASSLRGEITPKLDPVAVNFILSDSILYHIERRVTRSIPLAYDSASILLEGDFRLTSAVSLSPAAIQFTGPESLVNALPDPYIIPAAEDAVDESVEESFDIPLPESDLIVNDLSETVIKFEVDEFVSYQRSIPVMKLNFTDSTLALSPAAVDVSYSIKRSEEVMADSLDIMLIADFYSYNAQDSTVNVSVAVKATHIQDLVILEEKIKVTRNE
ncbi:MAG: hypothetical protein HEP71_19360 [Roseivirga sp.]|nr:hypothetical protein [Roseivirga sp.]